FGSRMMVRRATKNSTVIEVNGAEARSDFPRSRAAIRQREGIGGLHAGEEAVLVITAFARQHVAELDIAAVEIEAAKAGRLINRSREIFSLRVEGAPDAAKFCAIGGV